MKSAFSFWPVKADAADTAPGAGQYGSTAEEEWYSGLPCPNESFGLCMGGGARISSRDEDMTPGWRPDVVTQGFV